MKKKENILLFPIFCIYSIFALGSLSFISKMFRTLD